MLGFKVINRGFRDCYNFLNEVERIYESSQPIDEFNKNWIHFCLSPADIDYIYPLNNSDDELEYVLIEILGTVKHYNESHYSVTNKIKIIKIINRSELYTVKLH